MLRATMRYLGVLVLLACGSSTDVGDRKCVVDGDCTNGWKCVAVTEVRVATGDCLQSTGVNVCRPLCTTCPPPGTCGCVCP